MSANIAFNADSITSNLHALRVLAIAKMGVTDITIDKVNIETAEQLKDYFRKGSKDNEVHWTDSEGKSTLSIAFDTCLIFVEIKGDDFVFLITEKHKPITYFVVEMIGNKVVKYNDWRRCSEEAAAIIACCDQLPASQMKTAMQACRNGK